MAFLDRSVRGVLEKVCVAARDDAERAVDDAFAVYRVADGQNPHPDPARNAVRLALRKRARQIGNGRAENAIGYGPDSAFEHGLPHLREEIAYEAWHRLLFARFLAENGLLWSAEYGTALTLRDCIDLADGDARRGWAIAMGIAAERLPGLFHVTWPLELAPEAQQRLIAHVEDLPVEVFRSSDALGWVYQFWQKKRKDEVNASERKIAGADLSPVTQLFTEDYMVRFLLENTLGAWWAVRHPESPLLAEWEYLRFRDDGTPAAGTFDTWPQELREITVMDPCCGSGHFLVAAFGMLHRMRMEAYGESSGEAADAVLREQLYGLELDARCTQIAIFAVAMAAWQVGGHPEAVTPQIACSGIPVAGQLREWKAAAKGDRTLAYALEQIYALFEHAPTLGSLIEPQSVIRADQLWEIRWSDISAALERVTARVRADDPESDLFGGDALAASHAVELLARNYTLVATNVPYLSRGNHGEHLRKHADNVYPEAKADLATMFIQRCLRFAQDHGSVAVVSPQNWLFLGSYRAFRKGLLDTASLGAIARMGVGAFETVSGEVVNVTLAILDAMAPPSNQHFAGIDATAGKDAAAKNALLKTSEVYSNKQLDQHSNPNSIVSLTPIPRGALLSEFGKTAGGLCTFDNSRFFICFWETASQGSVWKLAQSTVKETMHFGGRTLALKWENGQGEFFNYVEAMRASGYTSGIWKAGSQIWGKNGILVSLMNTLPVSLYTGTPFDNNTGVIVTENPADLPAIWCFCSSPEFNEAVRRIDTALKVTNASLVKVPFDLERWTKVAEERYPNGLPEPHSDDPTQWLFEGDIASSEQPLQVAVARLLGYRWPEQPEESDAVDALADPDGIVCLPGLIGEQPAADRLRDVLAAAYGDAWSASTLDSLLAGVGFGGKDLAAWLADRKGFFAQHAKLFHNRPFIWQIGDGERGGFSALVNYHRLTRDTLNKLIYTYLDAWIARQREAVSAGAAGAERLLLAAQALREKLILIERGEPPFDIYVRWKSLAEQPMGWEPDLNDGVRLNIRPFVEAKVLHATFSINWNKDRGKDPARPAPDLTGIPASRVEIHRMHHSVDRFNDLHFTLDEKKAACERA